MLSTQHKAVKNSRSVSESVVGKVNSSNYYYGNSCIIVSGFQLLHPNRCQWEIRMGTITESVKL